MGNTKVSGISCLNEEVEEIILQYKGKLDHKIRFWLNLAGFMFSNFEIVLFCCTTFGIVKNQKMYKRLR